MVKNSLSSSSLLKSSSSSSAGRRIISGRTTQNISIDRSRNHSDLTRTRTTPDINNQRSFNNKAINLNHSKNNNHSRQKRTVSPSSSDYEKDQNIKQQELESFLNVSDRLVELFSTFYSRSFDIRSAKRWEQLTRLGYRPIKRPKSEHEWWEEEKRRGRIQPDHEPSSSLTSKKQLNHHHHPFNPIKRNNHTTTLNTKPTMLHKHSTGIMDLVGDAAQFGLPDLENYSSEDMDDIDHSNLFGSSSTTTLTAGLGAMRPGDFIELRRTNQSEIGVLIRTEANEITYLSRSGEIRLSSLDNVMYSLNGPITEQEASQTIDNRFTMDGLNQPLLPVQDQSSEPSHITQEELDRKAQMISQARKLCCRQIRVLESKLDQCHSMLVKAGSHNLYDRFRHSDPTQQATLSTVEGVRFLLGPSRTNDQIMIFALHQQLMANSDMFLANTREMRDRSTFNLQSTQTLTALYRVREWIARDSIELRSFVEKSQRLIKIYREKQADPKIAMSPIRLVDEHLPVWSTTDQMFIQVFRTTAVNQRMIQEQPYNTIVAHVLKRIGLYDDQVMIKSWPSLTLDRFGAIAFLREIGILPEWQTVGLWDPDLKLKQRVIATQTYSSPSRTSLTGSSKKTKARNHLSKVPKLVAIDPVERIRHDFGELDVYIIDDPDAEELDDGISIELIQEIDKANGDLISTGEAWIHIHVADPTAYLDPSDSISLQARQNLENIYLPGFTLPMLPKRFVETNSISLGSKKNGGDKTLSFSAKIDLEGEILDFKIRAGFIRNTKQVSYKTVSKILDEGNEDEPEIGELIEIGNQMEEEEKDGRKKLGIEELNKKDRDQIKELGRYSKALLKRRIKDGAIGWNLPLAKVTMKSEEDYIKPRFENQSKLMIGLPNVNIRLPSKILDLKRHRWDINSAQTLVTEMMILAGRLVGRFEDERKIEGESRMIFRSQATIMNNIGFERDLNRLREKIDYRNGLIDPFEFNKSNLRFLSSMNSFEPLSHFSLGIQDRYGYCKVTSPLRRYNDLILHFQIKKRLIEEFKLKDEYKDSNQILGKGSMNEFLKRLNLENQSKVYKNLSNKNQLTILNYIIKKIMKGNNNNSDYKFEENNKEGIRIEKFKKMIKDELIGVILNEPILMNYTNKYTFKIYIMNVGIKASVLMNDLKGFEDDDEDDNRGGLIKRFNEGFKLFKNKRDDYNDYDERKAKGNDLNDHNQKGFIGWCLPVKLLYINFDDHFVFEIDRDRL